MPDELIDAHLRAIFDSAFEFMGLLAPDGTLLEANRAALTFAGVTRDQVVGRKFWDTPWWGDAPEERDRVRQAVSDAAAGAFVRFETQHVGADGRTATVDFSLTPVPDAAGRVVRLIPEGRDISDRKRAEERLRLSEKKFHGILAISADAVISIDEEQRIELFNRGAEDIFGWLAAEVIGQPLTMLLPERQRGGHEAHVRGFAAGTGVARRMGERAEIVGRRKSGEVFPAEASISKIEVGGRRVFTAVLRDVTERKRAESERARLLELEKQARAMAESAERRASILAEASALFNTTLDFKATFDFLAGFVVPRLADICVVDLVDAEGSIERFDVVHVDAVTARVDAIRALAPDSGRSIPLHTLLSGESVLVSRVGDDLVRAHTIDQPHLALLQSLDVTSYLVVALFTRGRITGALTCMRRGPRERFDPLDLALYEDLARRAALAADNARLYEEAQRATRARDEVLGVVSHDLRNPLSAIGMFTSAMRVTPRPARGASDELLENIQRSVEMMNRLIQDLLDVAGIDSGRLSLERRAVPLSAIARATVELFQPAAAERGIALTSTIADELTDVFADPHRIQQVLANLIGNALKYTGEGGRVVVGADIVGAEMRVSVTDTGSGIPSAQIPFVFNRFWHAKGTASERGTGLGLAIAKGIVEAHGGRIWVASAESVGSTFTFTLPLAEARAGETPVPGATVAAPPAQRA